MSIITTESGTIRARDERNLSDGRARRCASIFAATAALGWTGCILPIPHTRYDTVQVHGRAVDAQTRAPVSGVEVFAKKEPRTLVRTGVDGSFRTRPAGHFQPLAIAIFPVDRIWEDEIVFRRTGYLCKSIEVSDFPGGDPIGYLPRRGLGDVPLVRSFSRER